jgi:hypothetical protein
MVKTSFFKIQLFIILKKWGYRGQIIQKGGENEIFKGNFSPALFVSIRFLLLMHKIHFRLQFQ